MPLKETGKLYKVNGKDKILYPISKLVSELNKAGVPRNAQTIRKWEDNGTTPESVFRVGNKRLYSIEQIQTYVRVAEECNIRQGYSIAMTGFSERIWEELEKVNKKYTSNK